MEKKLSAAAQLIVLKLYAGGMATCIFAHLELYCTTIIIILYKIQSFQCMWK